jgi:DNA repair protein RecO (recombination protein O)
MPVYKAEAIILRRQAVGEADRVITLFTREHGRLRTVARGVRRTTSRLAGRIEPFTHARLLLARGRTLDVIAQAEVVAAFAGLRADLTRSAYAAYVAELVDRFLPDRDRNESVFALLRTTLAALNQAAGEDAQVLALWFALHLAAELGYRPETEACVACGRRVPHLPGRAMEAWAFSPALGGALCPACRSQDANALGASPGILAAFEHLLDTPWERVKRLRLTQSQREEMAHLVQAHLEHRLEAKLRAPSVIRRLERKDAESGEPPASVRSSGTTAE